MEQMLQIHQNVYDSTDSVALGLGRTSFNATFRLENFKLFTMHHYPSFKELDHLFLISSVHQT